MLVEDIGQGQCSLIVDESTEKSCTKELGIVRYFARKSDSFATRFSGLVPITDTPANGIFLALKSFLDSCNVEHVTACWY